MTRRKRRKNACQLLILPMNIHSRKYHFLVRGTPAPGGGIPSSALGDFMRGMAGTWVYANRNEFGADDWF